MQSLFRPAAMALVFLLLSACQTLTSEHSISAGNLPQHNLYLTSASARFAEDKLIVAGGIRNITAPKYLACGSLSIEVFSQSDVLLKTFTTDYSPCVLHHSPTAKRTGYFSESVADIAPQPLRVKISYSEKPTVADR